MNDKINSYQAEFERMNKITNTAAGKYASQIKANQKNLYGISSKIQNSLDKNTYVSKNTINQLKKIVEQPPFSRRSPYKIPAGEIETLLNLSVPAFKPDASTLKKAAQFMNTNSSLLAKSYVSTVSVLTSSQLTRLYKNNELNKFLTKVQERFLPKNYSELTVELVKKSKNFYQNSFAEQIQKMGRVNLSASVQINNAYNALGIFSSDPLTSDQLSYAKQILGEQTLRNIFSDAAFDYPDKVQTSTAAGEANSSKITKNWAYIKNWYNSLSSIQKKVISAVIDIALSSFITEIIQIGGWTLLIAILIPILFGNTNDHDPK
ncbi:hypothetical protein [Secundilactobacillus mixtipabuli]|uniref:Uncharacterized protein n=1 Tax=Secundilactobacillus mixtipabuli TaxID=1435342 RepID=A0A1Z5ID54_9LACO|nr:hypothetical protein [Secundilactobacillus mixtipabuli]GAW99686.1 hypothetical protein IWT30_01656 [Secundilactobacillus mixtipabuli]